VAGLGVERRGSLVGDLADEFEGGADVGLGGPDAEFDNGSLESGGELGEALVVLEPGLQTLLVHGAELWDVGEHGGRLRRGVGVASGMW
jgi:hypothetical protein